MSQIRYAIIGGGVIGTCIARELASRKADKIFLFEKESALGLHASGRNSGVIHSGINQKPGSLKAQMCVEGSRLLRKYCREKGVPIAECGTLVIARNGEEKRLEQLLEMGKACDVPDLTLLDRDELKRREPLIEAKSALLSPTGAVVDPLKLLKTLAQEASSLGVEFRLNQKVRRIQKNDLITSEGRFSADYIINAAGLYADQVAHEMGVGLEYRVIPFRGEYMEVLNCPVRSMVYGVPDLRFPFLGIHFTRETDGRVLAGPSAVLAFGREAYQKEWKWKEMIEMFQSPHFRSLITHSVFLKLAFENAQTSLSKRAFLNQVRSFIPSINIGQLVPAKAGIRAQLVHRNGTLVQDMMVVHTEHSTHILNAVSPGVTCSLAFAKYVVDGVVKNRSG